MTDEEYSDKITEDPDEQVEQAVRLLFDLGVGRHPRQRSLSRAVEKKSAFGREVQYGTWIFQEWEGDLYYDSCHLTPPGSLELARSIGEAACELSDLVPNDR